MLENRILMEWKISSWRLSTRSYLTIMTSTMIDSKQCATFWKKMMLAPLQCKRYSDWFVSTAQPSTRISFYITKLQRRRYPRRGLEVMSGSVPKRIIVVFLYWEEERSWNKEAWRRYRKVTTTLTAFFSSLLPLLDWRIEYLSSTVCTLFVTCVNIDSTNG